jgi:hypothetical protein
MSDDLWFKLDSLKRLTDSRTWQKGAEIVTNRQVLSFEIELSTEHEWSIFCRVRGTHITPYQVHATIKLSTEAAVLSWTSSCSCPVHRGCKHGMASLIYASFHGREQIDLKFPDGLDALTAKRSEQFEAERKLKAQRLAEAQARQAELKLHDWLNELDRISTTASNTVSTNLEHTQHKRQIKPEQQYLYLLRIADQETPKPKLRIDTVSSHRKLNGEWAKPRIVVDVPAEYEIARQKIDRVDIEIMRLISTMLGSSHYYRETSAVCGVLEGRIGSLVLELAASTGRLLLNDSVLDSETTLRWGEARKIAWSWQKSAAASTNEQAWLLRPELKHQDVTLLLCTNTPPFYLDPQNGLCGPVDTGDLSDSQVAILLNAPILQESLIQKYQNALTIRSDIIPRPPVLAEIPILKGITPRRLVHLSALPPEHRTKQKLLAAQLTFNYDGHVGWWGNQPAAVTVESQGARALLYRDIVFEKECIESLFYDLNIDVNQIGELTLADYLPQVQWAHWFDTQFLEFTELGFEVTLDDSLKNWVHHAEKLIVDVVADQPDAPTNSDWFDVSLGMEMDGQRRNILPFLPALLAEAGRLWDEDDTSTPALPEFVYLPDEQSGRFIRIPTEAMKPWLQVMLEFYTDRGSMSSSDKIKLSRFDMLLISSTLGEAVTWQGATSIRQLAQTLNNPALIEEVTLPNTVNATLRRYQQDGLNWLQFLGQHGLGGILADDMGLGKTLQTLAHIQIEKDSGRLTTPALIIVPVSLLSNWQREAAKFCPELRCLVIHGKDRHTTNSDLTRFDLIIAPYSLLYRDRSHWLDITWHLVVLDEAQNIKNTNTQTSQVARELKARQRLCLSGTPIENHLGEIWSLFHFLMPGFLGNQKKFGELFRNPIEKQNDVARMKSLRTRITPFMLRRTKAEVAKELPPKIETITRVELSGKQADLYETIRLTTEKAVREALHTQGFAKSRITILDALLKLRQVCCDPRLIPTASAKAIQQSAKLSHLMEVLPKMLAEGRRILLFSQFTSMLSLIETELSKHDLTWVKLTGSSKNRDSIVERFTSGEVPLFLISLKAGGVGLNLPQADTVIHYDPWWNPAVENQATDRAHRIGQTQSVWVIKLVAQDTIEERILSMQERKAALAQNLYSDSLARKQPLFTESDLAELLKPLGA